MRNSRSYKGARRQKAQNGQTPSPYESYKYRRSHKTGSSFRRILSIMLLLFLIALIGIFIIGGIQNKNGDNESFFGALFAKLTNKESSAIDLNLPFGPHRENILLLGVDSNGADSDLWVGTRTDTIILMNVDPRTKTVNAISIPRDSKVYLPDGMGTQKINAAHAIGGIKMTIKTVEETLGVKIDHYIMFHDAGVRAIVKALGGVDIYVEKNMKYDDNAGKLHINISKGKHHLTDKDVVEYLRFRHDAMGDIGRTKRQQWFLRGLLADLKKPETVVAIPVRVSFVVIVVHRWENRDPA